MADADLRSVRFEERLESGLKDPDGCSLHDGRRKAVVDGNQSQHRVPASIQMEVPGIVDKLQAVRRSLSPGRRPPVASSRNPWKRGAPFFFLRKAAHTIQKQVGVRTKSTEKYSHY